MSVFKYRCLLNTGLFYLKDEKKRLKHTELFVRLIQGFRLLLSPHNIGFTVFSFVSMVPVRCDNSFKTRGKG